MNNIFYVYIFLRPDKPGYFNYGDNLIFDYEPFYVGKGHADRILTSKKSYNQITQKANIINKISELNLSIKSIKLKENLSEIEAYEYEKYVIQQIGRCTSDKYYKKYKIGPLTNLTNGGEGNENIPILQYDLNGIFIKEYTSLAIAEMETGIKNIYRVCKYRTATAGNYIWRYKINNSYDLKIDITFLNNLRHIGKPINKPVIQYDMEFNFIKRFNSIKEAEELTGCSKSKIVRVCQGHSSHTKKYKWKYE